MKEKKEITEKQALQKVARYCATAEHCISEVTEKLVAWGINSEGIQRIVEYLLKEKYIEESRYCQAFINDKLYHNKWGKIKISYMLYQKRIPSNIIDQQLAHIDYDKYEAILKKLLKSRQSSLKTTDEYERKNKLIRFAMSRGFEMENIKSVLGSLNDEE